jgi:hypothetical protein
VLLLVKVLDDGRAQRRLLLVRVDVQHHAPEGLDERVAARVVLGQALLDLLLHVVAALHQPVLDLLRRRRERAVVELARLRVELPLRALRDEHLVGAVGLGSILEHS